MDSKLCIRESLYVAWVKTPQQWGKVKSLAITKEGLILGVGIDNKLYSRAGLDAPWVKERDPCDGKMVKSITVAEDGTIYGVGMDHKIYTRANLDALWFKAPDMGGEVQAITMMADGTFLGVDMDNKLCTRVRLESPWVKAPDYGAKIADVSVMRNGTILGVGVDHRLYIRPSLEEDWTVAPDGSGKVLGIACYPWGEGDDNADMYNPVSSPATVPSSSEPGSAVHPTPTLSPDPTSSQLYKKAMSSSGQVTSEMGEGSGGAEPGGYLANPKDCCQLSFIIFVVLFFLFVSIMDLLSGPDQKLKNETYEQHNEL